MTLTLATDQLNDLVLDAGGNILVVSGMEAVESTARGTAQVRRGDMVLARDQGIPFETTAWAGDVTAYTSFLRRRLLALDGVIGIVSLETSRDKDVLRYEATLRTSFGTVQVNG